MERVVEPEAVVVPVAALVLASGAAVALGAAPLIAGVEPLFALTWLIGWTLVVWSAVLGGGCAVRLVLCARSRSPVLPLEVAITVAALALVVAVVAVHPLFASGSGTA
ncbi:hypothetical protein [Rathayibacter sp. VKM Ac-2754]|uniref:hypothetical protein n=1 Tax=Rathayibacter sp. VKM Ac-2754 TaxID=2609251 RepID=UPI001357FD35|nr:hypothetical protein [Rathayibacter sp. VKM Ac-2754]MWV59377.1 hypothetical protein [Rathayibacter sp. VKM Ac-2754]